MDIQFSQHRCSKDCSFPYWKEQHSCQKSVNHNYNHITKVICAYFGVCCSILFNHMSVLMPISHCFDYCSFEVHFEREVWILQFCSFFQDCSEYSEFLNIRMNFRIDLSVSAKSLGGIFIEIEFADLFEYYCLNNIKSSNPWTWDVFLFI